MEVSVRKVKFEQQAFHIGVGNRYKKTVEIVIINPFAKFVVGKSGQKKYQTVFLKCISDCDVCDVSRREL